MNLDRYVKQMRFKPLGSEGQAKLSRSHVLVVGVGAIGSHLAELLGRAGVGKLTLVDRDYVDVTNLHRQALYDEEDVRQVLPKAVAAANRLARINSQIHVTPIVADVHWGNLQGLLDGVDLIVDGSDNFSLRFLVNDASISTGIPWVYGGVVGATGMAMAVLPGQTPCLRCLFKDIPSPGAVPTCDAAGVLPSTVGMVTSYQSMEALKILSGQWENVTRGLFTFDLWSGDFQLAELQERDPDCPACAEKRLQFLTGRDDMQVESICGSNSVQVTPGRPMTVDLPTLAGRLSPLGGVTRNPYLLSFKQMDLEMILFKDGRAMIKGTTDPVTAKAFYTRMIGL